MPLRAVIDLGSNSVRLVVYDVKSLSKQERKEYEKDAARKHKLFKSLFDQKKVAGLSAYAVDGVFSREGQDKAIEVLQELSATASNLGCDEVFVFATAVLRNCENSKAAVDRIEKSAHIKIDVISEEEEAHLGFVGATCDRDIDSGTLIDVGGGSTELTRINDDHDFDNISIPQGCVSSYAKYVSLILPTPSEFEDVCSEMAAHLDKVPNLDAYRAEEMFGIGGSVRALDKLYAQLFSNENRLRALEDYQIDAVINMLDSDPSLTAHAITKAVPERIHSVMPGMSIIRTVMERCGAKRLTICKYGIREGYLLERVMGI